MVCLNPKRPFDTEPRTRMKELASERRRVRHRRLHILLKREDWEVNWKKRHRLYRDGGSTVRKRSRRKCAVGPDANFSNNWAQERVSLCRSFRRLPCGKPIFARRDLKVNFFAFQHSSATRDAADKSNGCEHL